MSKPFKYLMIFVAVTSTGILICTLAARINMAKYMTAKYEYKQSPSTDKMEIVHQRSKRVMEVDKRIVILFSVMLGAMVTGLSVYEDKKKGRK